MKKCLVFIAVVVAVLAGCKQLRQNPVPLDPGQVAATDHVAPPHAVQVIKPQEKPGPVPNRVPAVRRQARPTPSPVSGDVSGQTISIHAAPREAASIAPSVNALIGQLMDPQLTTERRLEWAQAELQKRGIRVPDQLGQ